MIKCVIFAMFSFLAVACSSGNVDPHMKYFAAFDNSKIELVDSVLDDMARRNDLEVFKKDRGKMQELSQGKAAFFTTLYFQGEPVLILTNVGVAEKLVFTVTDYGDMSLSELERITAEIIKNTEAVANLKFIVWVEK